MFKNELHEPALGKVKAIKAKPLEMVFLKQRNIQKQWPAFSAPHPHTMLHRGRLQATGHLRDSWGNLFLISFKMNDSHFDSHFLGGVK